jgi:membrane-associated phospholipid phosphatase
VRKKVYKLNYKFEIPVTAGLYGLNYYGFTLLRKKPALDSIQIVSLQKNNVWFYDRRALNQPIDQRFNAQEISDWGLNISLFLPVLLFIDKEIRRSWYDIALLYLETQAINANLYTWFGPMITKRNRPFVYYEDIPVSERMEKGTTDSFFSGHVSWTAGASFFMAKVLSDYHPEWGGKRWWLYAAALVPPVFVGYYRYRALKHFPTDMLVGGAIGAAVGILNPHLHKIKGGGSKVSIAPVAGGFTGLALRMKL